LDCGILVAVYWNPVQLGGASLYWIPVTLLLGFHNTDVLLSILHY